MSEHRLRLQIGSRQLEQLSANDFLWLPRDRGPSSMETSIGPRLEECGNVPPLHVDLVRLAALAFLADRSSLREQGPGVRWDRELDLTIPVSAPDAWNAAAPELAGLLHLLSGDDWQLTFEKERAPRRGRVARVASAQVVCLLSGGADSLAGSIVAHDQLGAPPVLVSHWDNPAASAVQRELVGRLESIWGTRPDHHRIQLQRRGRQIGSNIEFRDEKSRRSRSFLFIALGLAVAAARGAELWISENGFTGLNPPLSPERRGSLTTRTTHPGFLDGLSELLTGLGLSASIRNPLEGLTKGEVLARATKALPDGVAAPLFSATHSCGKTPWFKGFSQGAPCGLCFGCLVRRGSFVAADLEDSTEYVEEALRGQPRRRAKFVTPRRRSTIEAVRYRLGRRYQPADLLALGLPDRISIDNAVALANRGLDEMRPVVESIP